MEQCANESALELPGGNTTWQVTEECIPQPPSSLLFNVQEENCCRICLEEVNEVPYCKCTGSLLCHEACLRHYLNQRLLKNMENIAEVSCEICKVPYSVEIDSKYKLSITECCDKIRLERTRCVCYSLLFCTVIGYEIFMAVQWVTTTMLKALLLIIAVVMAAAMFIGLAFWVYEFMLQGVRSRIRTVLPGVTYKPITSKATRVHPL